jgi:hypothetical protein
MLIAIDTYYFFKLDFAKDKISKKIFIIEVTTNIHFALVVHFIYLSPDNLIFDPKEMQQITLFSKSPKRLQSST